MTDTEPIEKVALHDGAVNVHVVRGEGAAEEGKVNVDAEVGEANVGEGVGQQAVVADGLEGREEGEKVKE